MPKGHTQPKSAEYRRLQQRSKVRKQLRELVHAYEFYVDNRLDYLPATLQRMSEVIAEHQEKLHQ